MVKRKIASIFLRTRAKLGGRAILKGKRQTLRNLSSRRQQTLRNVRRPPTLKSISGASSVDFQCCTDEIRGIQKELIPIKQNLDIEMRSLAQARMSTGVN